ncbi:MAG: hypothetical protein ACT4QF_14050 [Sporichthyaceae bacterium]
MSTVRGQVPVYGLTCHETGHAVGLVHGEDAYDLDAGGTIGNQDSRLGCMMQTVPVNARLGTNQEQNINEAY